MAELPAHHLGCPAFSKAGDKLLVEESPARVIDEGWCARLDDRQFLVGDNRHIALIEAIDQFITGRAGEGATHSPDGEALHGEAVSDDPGGRLEGDYGRTSHMTMAINAIINPSVTMGPPPSQ